MTYLELQNQIADDLNRSDLSSQIQTAIKDAIVCYERQRFWFNEEVSTSSTVASQQTYTLPTDCLFVDMLQITSGTRTWELNRREWTDFEDYWSQNTTTGVPSDWSVEQNTLYLAPTPNAIFTLTISYVKSLTTLSADADTNEWTTTAKDLIRCHAESSLFDFVIHNSELSDRMTLRCAREMAMLSRENDQRILSGTVKAVYL